MIDKKIWEEFDSLPQSWKAYFWDAHDFDRNRDLLERLRAGLPEDMSNVLPELKEFAEKLHFEGHLWCFDSLYCVRPLHLSEEEYVFTDSGRVHKLISAYGNMLELEDVLSKKIWVWEDINRTFLQYGDTSRLEKRIYLKPSWWVIIREGKKYIGCSNNCEHLEEENGKIKCCYFEKEIEGEEDNYEPCEECLREYCETEFSSPNMTTEEKSF